MRGRRWVRLGVVLAIVAGAGACLGAGRAITREDALVDADAIYVLGGTWVQRWLEAVDLYKEGRAPRIVMSPGGWTRLIVITDRPNSRRAGFAMRRVLGPGVQVIVHASRHDHYDPARWWRSRPDFRATFYEVPKLFAYWLGLAG